MKCNYYEGVGEDHKTPSAVPVQLQICCPDIVPRKLCSSLNRILPVLYQASRDREFANASSSGSFEAVQKRKLRRCNTNHAVCLIRGKLGAEYIHTRHENKSAVWMT